MDFISIREYFYKLYSNVMIIVLLPIVAFIVLYLLPPELQQDAHDPSNVFALFSASIILLWILIFIIFNKKIKSIRNRQGLRSKLEKYFQLTIVRYTLISFTGLVLALVFFILRDDAITACFVLHMVLTMALWPTSGKACRDLKLRGDEWQMVYHKKDSL